MMNKQPAIDMNETITMTCVFCGRSETGKRRDIWRKDEWDWYTGYLSGRMEFCPSCVKARADEVSASKEYPKPTSAKQSKQSRIAELEAELTSANRALEMRNNSLEEARSEIERLNGFLKCCEGNNVLNNVCNAWSHEDEDTDDRP